MKKNYLKKVVSVFAATAVLAMGSSVMSAFAADDSLSLVIPEKEVILGSADTVDLTLEITGDNKLTANSIGLMISYDSALKYVSSTSDVFPADHITSSASSNKLMFSKGGETQYGNGTKLITVKFEVPDKAGKYEVKWVDFPGMNFYNMAVDPDTLVNYTYDNGFINVIEPIITTTTAPTTTTTAAPTTTTTAAPTTTVTTVTTTAAPTTSVTTTAAPTTSVPKTTTTGAKVTKDTAKNSPATGTSSNGVAALAATMVVAAGAAIVLKKKKD